MLRSLAAAGTLGTLSGVAAGQAGKVVTHGKIKQSIAFWCFNAMGERWELPRLCEIAKELGVPSIELVAPDQWATLKRHDLVCAMAPNGMPGAPFMRGLNNPRFHEEVITRTKKTIDDCADARFPNVIAFTGYKYTDPDNAKSAEISRDDAAEACIKGLKDLASYAEKKNVTVCLEHLNTRDGSHPMKGHPGYHGDDLDWVAGIIRKVGSQRVKLLFDVYHVQVMHGDVLRRLEQNRDILGHIHTAGNPGRGELDDRQEIQYAPVMKKLLELKYDGYVGQEFIPTRNALEGLRQAVRLCDVE
jgi:hydroxypyruvate isomerase